MSEEEHATDEQISEARPSGPAVDPLLSIFVKLANNASITSMSVTLWLPGGVITGLLIGKDVYFKELFAKFRAAGEFGKVIADALEGLDAKPQEADQEKEIDVQQPEPRVIHQRDARVMTGGQLVPQTSDGALWRGRLADVTGYAFTNFGQK